MDYLIQTGTKTLKVTNVNSADDTKKKLKLLISKFEDDYNAKLVEETTARVIQIMQEYGQKALDEIDQIKELGQKWSQASDRKSKAAITRKMSGLAREVGNIFSRYVIKTIKNH